MPALNEQGIWIHEYADLNEAQRKRAQEYFQETVFPVLTPLAFDPGRPFPHISNLSLNLAVLIRDRAGTEHFARVKVPDSLPQLLPVNATSKAKTKGPRQGRVELVWLEQVIAANLGALFPGMEVLESHPFHVTRDADMAIKELEAEDLLETIEEGIRQRRFQSVVRLMVTSGHATAGSGDSLQQSGGGPNQVYRTYLSFGVETADEFVHLPRPELKEPPFVRWFPPTLAEFPTRTDIFATIRKLRHPDASPVRILPAGDRIRAQSRARSQRAGHQDLPVSGGANAPVVEALLEAVEEDKQVAALVELKARFDEESNIEWAKALERAGVHVVYGIIGLKVHCKVTLVVRREQDRIARYVHLSPATTMR